MPANNEKINMNEGLQLVEMKSMIDFFRINRSVYYKTDKDLTIIEFISGLEDVFPSVQTTIGRKLPEVLPFEMSKKILKIINDIVTNDVHSIVDVKLPKTESKIFQAGIQFTTEDYIIIIIQEGIGNLLSRELMRKTESRFSLIWEKSIDGMRLLDSNGRMVALNPAFGRIVQLDIQKLIGKKYYEVYDNTSDDFQTLDEEYSRKFKTRTFDDFFITKLRLKTGRFVYLEVSNNFIDSFQGDLELFEGEVLLFSILRDITDRKNAEDKVRDREELYRSLIETSPDAICLYIPDGKIITCNQQAAELFGHVNINEMLEYKDNFFGFFAESSRVIAMEDSRKILEYGHLNNMEYEFIKFDGSAFYGELSSSVLFSRVNYPRAIVSVLRNITERKLASEKIKWSELRFRSVWENSIDGMRLTDSEGTIMEVNKAYCNMIGMQYSELKGKNLYAVYRLRSKEDYERKVAKYKNDFARRSFKPKYNNLNILNNGKRLLIDSSFSFVEYQNTEVLLLSVLRDVTEKREIEEKLNHSSKLAAIGKMAAYLTHEMKTPLSSIKLSVDILAQSLQTNEQQERPLIILKKEIKRLEKLLKDVLHFSKASELNITEIDLNVLIENIRELLSPILAEKNITLLNNIESVKIEGDYQKLFSAFLQILENSVDAISYSGTIELFSKIESDNKVNIYIRDDGSGIEENEKIFDAFYSTKSSGTGLGLAIARNTIEHHNGSIQLISSKPGETIFEISFNIGI